jgi:hypothetical protein
MTQEEKQLLLIDLCARLPYGVKTSNGHGILELSPRTDVIYIVDNGHIPYLRPMPSMTEEEMKEYNEETDLDVKDSSETLMENLKAKMRVRVSKWYHGNDWLNAHHFDYRGLIPIGLALEAPEGMYKDTQHEGNC